MKRFLSLILLTILLPLAICSCRSSKQSAMEYSDTTSVAASEVVSTLSKEDLLSIFSASRERELSGIKIEFFPPDSAHPDTRAAPRSLTIENAKTKESTEQATHETVDVDEQKTVNLSAQSSASLQQDSRNNNDILHPHDWVFFLGFTCTLILSLLIYLFKK